jgi:hypothetical protein
LLKTVLDFDIFFTLVLSDSCMAVMERFAVLDRSPGERGSSPGRYGPQETRTWSIKRSLDTVATPCSG